jgi:hypothetical protein
MCPHIGQEIERMVKERSGYVYQDKITGRWFARVTLTDAHGKRRNIRRQAENESKAEALLRKLNRNWTSAAERMTFSELAEKYRAFVRLRQISVTTSN